MACARRSCTMWAASHPRRLPGRGQRRWHALCTWCARAAVSGRVRRARAPRARAPLCAPVVRSFVEVDFGVYGEPVWLEIDDAAVPIAHGGCSGHVRDACGSLGAILRQKQVGKKCFGFRPASAATRQSRAARVREVRAETDHTLRSARPQSQTRLETVHTPTLERPFCITHRTGGTPTVTHTPRDTKRLGIDVLDTTTRREIDADATVQQGRGAMAFAACAENVPRAPDARTRLACAYSIRKRMQPPPTCSVPRPDHGHGE